MTSFKIAIETRLVEQWYFFSAFKGFLQLYYIYIYMCVCVCIDQYVLILSCLWRRVTIDRTYRCSRPIQIDIRSHCYLSRVKQSSIPWIDIPEQQITLLKKYIKKFIWTRIHSAELQDHKPRCYHSAMLTPSLFCWALQKISFAGQNCKLQIKQA
jgi:hypothetical protein